MDHSICGKHILVDIWGNLDISLINDVNTLEEILVEAANKCGATVQGVQSKKFDPIGVSVLVMLSESHLSIHTYPEAEFAAIDCYTCGAAVDTEIAIKFILSKLKPQTIYMKQFARGSGELKDIS